MSLLLLDNHRSGQGLSQIVIVIVIVNVIIIVIVIVIDRARQGMGCLRHVYFLVCDSWWFAGVGVV